MRIKLRRIVEPLRGALVLTGMSLRTTVLVCLALMATVGCRRRVRHGIAESPAGVTAKAESEVKRPYWGELAVGEENLEILRNATSSEVILLSDDRVRRSLTVRRNSDGTTECSDSWQGLGSHFCGSRHLETTPALDYDQTQRLANLLLGARNYRNAYSEGVGNCRVDAPDLLVRIRRGMQEATFALSVREASMRRVSHEEEQGFSLNLGEDMEPARELLRSIAHDLFPAEPRFSPLPESEHLPSVAPPEAATRQDQDGQ